MPKLPALQIDLAEKSTVPVHAPAPSATKTSTSRTRTSKTTTPAPDETTARATKQRVSAYLTMDQFQQVRDAYVTDLAMRGTDAPLNLGEWVAQAIRRHNALTPEQRQKAAAAIPEDTATRKPRSWALTVDTIAGADDALAAEIAEGRRLRTLTPYVTEAVLVAVQRTLRANGGVLHDAGTDPLPPRRR